MERKTHSRSLIIDKKPWLIKAKLYNFKFINFIAFYYIFAVVFFYTITERPQLLLDRTNFISEFGLVIITYLLYFLARYFINGVYSLFGIDMIGDKNKHVRIRCEPLFDMNSYESFQKEIMKYFSRSKSDIFVFLLGFTFTSILTAPSIISGQANYAGADPYIVYTTPPNGPNLYFVLRVAMIFPITTLLTSGFLSIVVTLIKLIIVFDKVGKSDKIAIKQIDSIISSDSRSMLEFNKRSDIIRFSLKRFKQRATVIPQFMLIISIFGMFISMLIGIVLNSGISVIEGENQDLSNLNMTTLNFILIFALVLVNIFLFIYPQLSLKRIIADGKYKTVDMLEEMLVVKQYQWLSRIGEQDVVIQDNLYNEILGLSTFIEEIENLLTWPFNYKQIVTLLGSAVVTFIIPVYNNLL